MNHRPPRWRLALAAFAAAASVRAEPSSPAEAELKAALALNFARYVEWPDRAFAHRDAPLVFCLVGRDSYGAAFSALESRRLAGRALKVRRSVAPDDLRGCHLVFVSELDDRRLPPLLHGLAGQPVLTVGDADGFIDHGGAIGIVPGEQRLQFEVNRAALEQAQLKASSQLLKLARAVLNPGS